MNHERTAQETLTPIERLHGERLDFRRRMTGSALAKRAAGDACCARPAGADDHE